jgi:hypothetical protein
MQHKTIMEHDIPLMDYGLNTSVIYTLNKIIFSHMEVGS